MNDTTAHPFELAGMGTGPYRFVGMYSLPTPSLAEANPEAYQNALRDMPRNLIGGCGTCSNCGMGIVNICIIEDAQGRHYGVGSDCVLKTDDASLGDAAKVAVARHRRNLARERKERQYQIRREAFLNTVCSTGETNRDRLAREQAERDAKAAAERAAQDAKAQILAPLAADLRDGRGGFRDSVANDLSRGLTPRGRGLDITLDILSGLCGRRDSAAYNAEYDRLSKIFESLDSRSA